MDVTWDDEEHSTPEQLEQFKPVHYASMEERMHAMKRQKDYADRMPEGINPKVLV